jgi:D-glycero-D-manno-heptose 1,7-bisphosphate phosphatase
VVCSQHEIDHSRRGSVINHNSRDCIKLPQEWRPISGSLKAIARLNHAGYRVVVAGNQSDIGRGLFGICALKTINRKMDMLFAPLGGRIEAVYLCPHTPSDSGACRKPKPGLFKQIAKQLNVDLE